MKTKFITAMFIAASYCVYGQKGNVGINTENPEATLDVNGNLKIRTTPTTSLSDEHQLMVIDNTSKEVKTIDPSVFDSSSNTTIAKVEAVGNGADLGIIVNSGYQKINFQHNPAFSSSDLDLANDVYTVPTDGVYSINFSYKYDEGIQIVGVGLSGYPRIGIFKGANLINEANFGKANAASFSILSSTATINSVYHFSEGDKISFQINLDNLNIDLLSKNIIASAIIYKISN